MTDPCSPTAKRKRGGQPGNSNALKHGNASREWRKRKADLMRAFDELRLLDLKRKALYSRGKRVLTPRNRENE